MEEIDIDAIPPRREPDPRSAELPVATTATECRMTDLGSTEFLALRVTAPPPMATALARWVMLGIVVVLIRFWPFRLVTAGPVRTER